MTSDILSPVQVQNKIITTGYYKNTKHYNTEEWRASALQFEQTGRYTNYPINSHPNSMYYKFWEEEARRGVFGYDIGRDWIPGYLYFYLNYCPIPIAIERNDNEEEKDFDDLAKQAQADREDHFPHFWDDDYTYFHYLDESEKAGEHGAVVKTRGRGFSLKGGSMCDRNYYLIPGSKSYCFADDKDYLIEDGIITKAWDMMTHIENYTPWGKRRQVHNSVMHRRASYYTQRSGLKIEKGFKSEIIGVSLKNNWNKARGKRGKLILYEESGKNPNLLKAWNISLKSMQQGRLTFGLQVGFGTGGTEGQDFMGLEQLFYEGGGYNVHMIPNKWDSVTAGSKSGFFSSVLKNLEGTMDKDGNSDTELADKLIEADRDKVKRETKNPEAIIRHIAEEPKTPQEACMRIGGTIFPINDLKEQLAHVRTHPEKFEDTEYVGKLVIDPETEKIKWEPDPEAKPIRIFPLNDKKLIEGCIIIYEHPVAGEDGEVPYGLYISGNDAYDHDDSTTDSLGSTFIMNKVTGRIVAEYTGRPLTANMYYENVRRLLIYYHAKCNYENDCKGMGTYMNNTFASYLLCDTPKVVADRVVDKIVLNRGKGSPGTQGINKWARELILIWLVTKIAKDSELTNLHTIRSIPLLQELIYWHKDGNFDRCLMPKTVIHTIDGYKNINKIKVGDFVLTRSGVFNRVKKVHINKHNGLLYNISILGQPDSINATHNHPILVKRYLRKPNGRSWRKTKSVQPKAKYINASEIRKGDFVLIPKRRNLQTTLLKEDILYLLGWYLADGWVSKDTNVVKIYLHSSQYEIGLNLVDIINKYFKRDRTFCKERIDKNSRKIKVYYNTQGSKAKIYKDRYAKEMYVVEMHSKELQELLTKNCGKANNKLLSNDLFKSKGLFYLMLGYFEGDGHYRSDKRSDGAVRNSLECSTIYKKLIFQIRQLLLDDGIWSTIRFIDYKEKRKKGENVKDQYSLAIAGNNCKIFIDKSLKFSNEFKYRGNERRNYLQDEEGFWVPVKEVYKYDYIGNVYNLSVEHDETFVAENILTHNCSALGMLMLLKEDMMHFDPEESHKALEVPEFFARTAMFKYKAAEKLDPFAKIIKMRELRDS